MLYAFNDFFSKASQNISNKRNPANNELPQQVHSKYNPLLSTGCIWLCKQWICKHRCSHRFYHHNPFFSPWTSWQTHLRGPQVRDVCVFLMYLLCLLACWCRVGAIKIHFGMLNTSHCFYWSRITGFTSHSQHFSLLRNQPRETTCLSAHCLLWVSNLIPFNLR